MTIKTMLIAALLLGSAAACSKSAPKYPLTSSTSTPAARGNVDVEAGPNGNTRVVISVSHLAQPSSITPSATTYVAWIVPRGNFSSPGQPDQSSEPRPINVGAIEVSDDLEGKLETITPFEQFDVIITPEPSAIAMRPSRDPVLTARIQEL